MTLCRQGSECHLILLRRDGSAGPSTRHHVVLVRAAHPPPPEEGEAAEEEEEKEEEAAAAVAAATAESRAFSPPAVAAGAGAKRGDVGVQRPSRPPQPTARPLDEGPAPRAASRRAPGGGDGGLDMVPERGDLGGESGSFSAAAAALAPAAAPVGLRRFDVTSGSPLVSPVLRSAPDTPAVAAPQRTPSTGSLSSMGSAGGKWGGGGSLKGGSWSGGVGGGGKGGSGGDDPESPVDERVSAGPWLTVRVRARCKLAWGRTTWSAAATDQRQAAVSELRKELLVALSSVATSTRKDQVACTEVCSGVRFCLAAVFSDFVHKGSDTVC